MSFVEEATEPLFDEPLFDGTLPSIDAYIETIFDEEGGTCQRKHVTPVADMAP